MWFFRPSHLSSLYQSPILKVRCPLLALLVGKTGKYGLLYQSVVMWPYTQKTGMHCVLLYLSIGVLTLPAISATKSLHLDRTAQASRYSPCASMSFGCSSPCHLTFLRPSMVGDAHWQIVTFHKSCCSAITIWPSIKSKILTLARFLLLTTHHHQRQLSA